MAHWADAELMEKARSTGVIHEAAETQVVRSSPGFVIVTFDQIVHHHPDGA